MIEQAIEVLSKRGIPTSSYVDAIQHINSSEDKTTEKYMTLISELVDFPVDDFEDPRYAKYTYLYLVQELVRDYNLMEQRSMNDILRDGVDKGKKFVDENEWVFAEPEGVEHLDEDGNPRPKKGAKQEAAYELFTENRETLKRKDIIQLFMDELDMSKAGATTYYHNMKNRYEEENNA